ncbi:MAG TPA: DinB family protein [Anaerolineae bacterium]
MPELEVATFIESFRALREKLLRNLESLSPSALNWKPPAPDTNSAFVLATHLIGSEKFWFWQVIAGNEIHRDRQAEFAAQGTDASLFRQELAQLEKASEAILNGLSESDLASPRHTRYGDRSVRWCILHMHEHYAEHNAHIELTRQLWEFHQAH